MKNFSFNSWGKLILSKIPIFLFCVAFVGCYGAVFGSENSIVGVSLLTALLLFITNDFGYKAVQAAIMIPVLFLVALFAAKISLINPYLGIVVNSLSIWCLLLFSSHNIASGNHLPLLLGYIFFQGYDVTGDLFKMRLTSIVLISGFIGIIYYLQHRKNTYRRSIKDLVLEMRLQSTRTQWYIKLTVTLTFVMFVCDLLNYPKSIWISFAVLSILQPLQVDATHKAKHRLPATLLATVIFYILVAYLLPEGGITIISIVFGFVASLASSYFSKTTINTICALCTAAMLYSVTDAIFLRIISNTIGTLVAFLSHYIFQWHFRRYSLSEE